MLQFRHYKPNNGKYNEPMYGWSFMPSKGQPTFDFYWGKHVFVIFWMGK